MTPPAKSAPAKAGAVKGDEAADQGSERRRALVTLAADLFAERGYKATTVRDIADAAGVLSGSLYHHFASKESIIDELLSNYLDELLESTRRIIAASSSPVECFGQLVREAFHSLDDHRAAITVLQNERQFLIQFPRFAYLEPRQAEIRRLWVGVLKAGMESGDFRRDMDPTVTYRLVRDSVWVAVRWFKPNAPLSSDDLATQYLSLFLEGISGVGTPGQAPSARKAARTKASR